MPRFPERASALERRIEPDTSEPQPSVRARVEHATQPTSASSAPIVSQGEAGSRMGGGGLIDVDEPSVFGAGGGAAAAARSAAGPVDILSQLEQLGSNEQPAAPPSDPLAALEAFSGGSRAAPEQVSVQPTQDTAKLLRKLLLADSGASVSLGGGHFHVIPVDARIVLRRYTGLLYEDPYLQIGTKCEFRDAQARVTLFLGNKSTQPLHNLRLHVHAVPGLATSDVSPVPPLLEAQRQVQVVAMFACTAAFSPQTLPSVAVSYALAEGHVSVTLQLPLVPTKFLGAAPPMEKTQFYDAWRALGGPPQKLETVLQVAPDFAAGGLNSWHALFAALRLNVLPGIDPNPLNVFAASALCAAGAAPPLCIVRLESDARNAAQFRLTVASPNGTLSNAVRDMVLMATSG